MNQARRARQINPLTSRDSILVLSSVHPFAFYGHRHLAGCVCTHLPCIIKRLFHLDKNVPQNRSIFHGDRRISFFFSPPSFSPHFYAEKINIPLTSRKISRRGESGFSPVQPRTIYNFFFSFPLLLPPLSSLLFRYEFINGIDNFSRVQFQR